MKDSLTVPEKLGIPDYQFRVVFGGTQIDYDLDKEETNRKKHGYSLESAAYLLERLILPLGNPKPWAYKGPFTENGEVRYMHMSVDDEDHVVLMVVTMRPDETVRVISFRRASPQEREEFKSLTGFAESDDRQPRRTTREPITMESRRGKNG